MQYLVSGLEMAALDRQTIDNIGVPGRALMEVAGRAVASYGLFEMAQVQIDAAEIDQQGANGWVLRAEDLPPDGQSASIHRRRSLILPHLVVIGGEAIEGVGELGRCAGALGPVDGPM